MFWKACEFQAYRLPVASILKKKLAVFFVQDVHLAVKKKLTADCTEIEWQYRLPVVQTDKQITALYFLINKCIAFGITDLP